MRFVVSHCRSCPPQRVIRAPWASESLSLGKIYSCLKVWTVGSRLIAQRRAVSSGSFHVSPLWLTAIVAFIALMLHFISPTWQCLGPGTELVLNNFSFSFLFFSAVPCVLWGICSPTKDWTHTPCIGRQSLSHWSTREVLAPQFLDPRNLSTER